MKRPRFSSCFLVGVGLVACGGDSTNSAVDGSVGADSSISADAAGPCASLTCVSGTCTETGTTATCECDAGWEGATCDAIIPPPATGLVVWLDANDPTNTGTPPTAGAQSVWVDKTGLTSNFVAQTGEEPMAVAGPGGNMVFEFDGNNDWMASLDSDALTGVGNYTVIIIGRALIDQNTFLAGTDTVSKQENPGLIIQSADNNGPNLWFLHRAPFGTTGGDEVLTVNNAMKTDALNRIWVTRNPDAQLYRLSAFINDGITQVNSTGFNVNFPNNMNLVLGRAGNNADTQYLAGQIAEVLIYVGVKTPSMNPEIAAYLQAKWGVE